MKLWGYRDYPDTLTINKQEWRIQFCSKVPVRHYGKEEVLGLCDPDQKTLYIRYKQTKFQLMVTMFHESLHAIEDVYGFTIDRRPKHPKVYDLAEAIGQIFKDNF